MSKLRVVQWTTGKTGTAAVRGLVGHPALELVGCYAYSPEKVGRDVGELAGIAPIGVTATDDVEALLALKPDCVAYMAYRPDFDQLDRILSAGVNIVSTMYMLAGAGYGEDVRDRLAAACERGRSSLYTTGVYPGHMGMTVLAASAMCTRIDRISLLESLDMSGYANERMFRAMSIGLDPDDPAAPGMIEVNCGSFKEQIRVLAQALAIELDEVRFTAEFAAATDDVDFGFMKLEKGQISGFKGVIAGISGGRSVIECRFVWKVGDQMTPNWPVEDGYVLEIEGDPGVQVRLAPIGSAHFASAGPTAMPAINAIPHVVAAAPGIVNHADLPFVTGRHLLNRENV
ncbi:dihydrodipicolinate reductase [Parafrankia sp. EUN1f]|uniref:NAD(P)H-dependent amine dehydrogenase family protein n=1 Tax=Parafrankia sp. EUN1f TaxID=102897 RepID=UPI0001C44E62|nr:dihydrodipicolinate reductase [Parafrankia sp. EUN1f]EFC83358.1 dihydrodipicolinate reductase [Parafrankia sp. EUN1f]